MISIFICLLQWTERGKRKNEAEGVKCVFFFITDALIDAIQSDIAYADTQLDLPEFSDLYKHSFFNAEKPQDISGNLIFTGSSL